MPDQTFFKQNFATLTFSLMSKNQILKSLFENNDLDDACFVLVCKTEEGKALLDFEPLDEMMGGGYCIANVSRQGFNRVSSLRDCNGFAKPKFENGQCVCTFPYMGETCDKCAEGFNEVSIKLKSKKEE